MGMSIMKCPIYYGFSVEVPVPGGLFVAVWIKKKKKKKVPK
jgi:hypothetical protein